MPKRTQRDAKPGELSEIKIMETLERMSKRTESRIDLQRVLTSLTPNAEKYVKHLINSGPSSLLSAAKACELKVEEIEAAIAELERGLNSIR